MRPRVPAWLSGALVVLGGCADTPKPDDTGATLDSAVESGDTAATAETADSTDGYPWDDDALVLRVHYDIELAGIVWIWESGQGFGFSITIPPPATGVYDVEPPGTLYFVTWNRTATACARTEQATYEAGDVYDWYVTELPGKFDLDTYECVPQY